MSLSVLVGFAGVLVAAAATGMLAGRCVRRPAGRRDLVGLVVGRFRVRSERLAGRPSLAVVAPIGLAALMTVALRLPLPAGAAYPVLGLVAAGLVWFGMTRDAGYGPAAPVLPAFRHPRLFRPPRHPRSPSRPAGL